jgi:hypothetical protein
LHHYAAHVTCTLPGCWPTAATESGRQAASCYPTLTQWVQHNDGVESTGFCCCKHSVVPIMDWGAWAGRSSEQQGWRHWRQQLMSALDTKHQFCNGCCSKLVLACPACNHNLQTYVGVGVPSATSAPDRKQDCVARLLVSACCALVNSYLTIGPEAPVLCDAEHLMSLLCALLTYLCRYHMQSCWMSTSSCSLYRIHCSWGHPARSLCSACMLPTSSRPLWRQHDVLRRKHSSTAHANVCV